VEAVPRRRPATSVDVARAAGVSQTTVSLVFSGRAAGRVSDRTRELVERTAAELGYAPNTSARVLRGGRPQVLALAVPNVRNEYFSAVLVGGEVAAREQGMAMLLMDTSDEPDWVERMIDMDRAGMFAGAIVYAQPGEVTARLAAEVERLVFVECPEPQGRPAVDLDLAGGMRQVVEHLRALGHRRIGHARADLPRETFRLRAVHLADELGAEPAHFSSDFDVDEATARAVDFLRANEITAIFCDDDLLAGAVYRACAQLGRSIPGELSVIGFNDVALTRYLAPELTSVAIPAETVGRLAVRALLGDDGALVPLTLRVRASTAAPR
jgi:LacI family transcriptional regulator/LacI family repressor for deo operon, udp, cdd, tsx, nupC, and nupG